MANPLPFFNPATAIANAPTLPTLPSGLPALAPFPGAGAGAGIPPFVGVSGLLSTVPPAVPTTFAIAPPSLPSTVVVATTSVSRLGDLKITRLKEIAKSLTPPIPKLSDYKAANTALLAQEIEASPGWAALSEEDRATLLTVAPSSRGVKSPGRSSVAAAVSSSVPAPTDVVSRLKTETMDTLKKVAKVAGVTGYSKMTAKDKEELVNKILEKNADLETILAEISPSKRASAKAAASSSTKKVSVSKAPPRPVYTLADLSNSLIPAGASSLLTDEEMQDIDGDSDSENGSEDASEEDLESVILSRLAGSGWVRADSTAEVLTLRLQTEGLPQANDFFALAFRLPRSLNGRLQYNPDTKEVSIALV